MITQEDAKAKALPCSRDTATSNTTTGNKTFEVDGETITFDNLGPMIINTDGTIGRITNWTEITDFERERTLKLIARRNKKRRQNLEQQQQQH